MTTVFQPHELLVVFDVDNVIIPGQTQKCFLGKLLRAGDVSLFSFSVVCSWFLLYKAGITVNTQRIRRYAYRQLAGKRSANLRQLCADLFQSELRPKIFPAAMKKIASYRDRGATVILMSSSLREIVERIQEYIGVETCIATNLEVRNGSYTGEIQGGVPYGEGKVHKLQEFIAENGPYRKIIAYCDHDSDLPLLEYVHEPIIVNPNKRMRRLAEERRWRVEQHT
ncbi:MAG: HAD-IB family hydrolase [Candidatus Omnitrophica bacterium]|nr:HAD-IB family hydrolase [Candidatus Omnitrophota bacterium]